MTASERLGHSSVATATIDSHAIRGKDAQPQGLESGVPSPVERPWASGPLSTPLRRETASAERRMASAQRRSLWGSSIYGMGAPPDEPKGWPVKIKDPWDNRKTLAEVAIREDMRSRCYANT